MLLLQLKEQISKELLVIIEVYRDDADLQNLIDWVQADWVGIAHSNKDRQHS